MGNQLTQPSRLAASEAVAELGGSVTFKDTLGGGRFFKSALCVHDDGGLVVVKIYAKPADSPDLRPHRERLLVLRAALAGLDHPHAWPVQRLYESERAAFLVRQYLHANLAQRITTRPFLTFVEKQWIAYQLLLALAQCHARGVCHGDIKAENVALTSWDWAFLVDFAPYKPTLLPSDNPADFSFFFDTSGRRKCCLAPERFYDPAAAGLKPQQVAAAQLTPAMDVFALGCVLAELFLDGQPLFDYSRLLAYRANGPASGALAPLDKVHPSMRGLILHMVQRNPAQRWTAHQCLQEASSKALPPWLVSVVHPFFASMLRLDTDTRLATAINEYADVKSKLLGDPDGATAPARADSTCAACTDDTARQAASESGPAQDAGPGPDETKSLDSAVGALLFETQDTLKRLEGRNSLQHAPLASGGPNSTTQLDQSPTPPPPQQQQNAAGSQPSASTTAAALQYDSACLSDSPGQHGGMALLAVLLCTLLRGSRLQEHKARVVCLLRDAAAYCDDETRLQRVLPYLVAATAEPLAVVKVVALRAASSVLAQVRMVPPSDAKVFNEYLLPSLSLLPSEAELLVQVEYASCIAQLASTAQAFLEQLQQRRLRASGMSESGSAGSVPVLNYDEEMVNLRGGVEKVVHDLLVGPHVENKLAVLPRLAHLAAFLGRRDTADVLLPSLLTFFNSQSWQVRAMFYSTFVGVCPSLGPEGVAGVVLPFLDRLLADAEPGVLAEAVNWLTDVAQRGLLRKRHLLLAAGRVCSRQLLDAAAPVPVRAAAVRFVAAVAAQLSEVDVYAHLLPAVLPHLTSEPLDLKVPREIVRVMKGGDGLRKRGVDASRQGSQAAKLAAPEGNTTVQEPGPGSVSSQQYVDLLAKSSTPVASNFAGTSASVSRDTPSTTDAHARSRSLLLSPPAASLYSLSLEPRFLEHASSYLAAALEQSLIAQSGVTGHILAPNRSAGQHADPAAGSTPGDASVWGPWGPTDYGHQLVARAQRTLPQSPGIVQHMRLPALAPGPQQSATAAMQGTRQRVASTTDGVRDAMNAALAAGMPGSAGATAPHVTPWYPRGVLVAHLAEHKKTVNKLAVAEDQGFFASASSDETVKIWDCRRLDKDVSFRSRLTYAAQQGRISSVTACQDSQSMASGSDLGSIHVWRVEYAARAGGAPERYTGIVGCRQVAPKGSAVLDLAAWTPALLVYSTQHAGLLAWDLRTGRDVWALNVPPAAGVVEHFALDPASLNWVLGGTSRGQMWLWDVRFQLPVQTWKHSSGTRISALALASAQPHRLGLSEVSDPLAYVAAGDHEVGLWDVAEAKCRQVLRVLQPGNNGQRRQVPAALATSLPATPLLANRGLDIMSRARQLAVSELQAPQGGRHRAGVTALLPTAGGQLLTGGTDCTVRCWDSGRPPQSYVVCAPPPPILTANPAAVAGAAADPLAVGGTPVLAGAEGSQVSLVDVPQYAYTVRTISGVPMVEEECSLQRSSSSATASSADREQHFARMGWAERAAALCHQLPITDLLCVESSERLLLSSGADGVIKAWR